MLTGLKVFLLTCKCVFYRAELNAHGGDSIELNFEGLKVKHTKRLDDEKNEVICLVIMFTSGVMAFKMSEITNFI